MRSREEIGKLIMETGTAISGPAPSAGPSALDKDTLKEAIKEALLELAGECLATPAPTGNGHVPRSFNPCELLALHANLA